MQVLEQYPNLKVSVEPRASIARAWNIGIARATGDAIMLLNADDYLAPDALGVAGDALARVNGAAILIGDVDLIDEQGNVLRHVRGRPPRWTNVYRGLPFLHPSVVVSRSIYDVVGPFDERCRVGLDADWLVRAYMKPIRFVYSPHRVSMRVGGLSDTRAWIGFGEYLETLERAQVGTATMVAALLNKAAVLAKRRLFGPSHPRGRTGVRSGARGGP